MKVSSKEIKRGIKIVMGDQSSSTLYPENVWKTFPKNMREVLIDNLAYSKTMIVTLVDGFRDVEYNTSTPLLKPFFDTCCIKDIPRIPFDRNNGLKPYDLFGKFINSEYKFVSNEANYPNYDVEAAEGAITALSFGKDSLLSYALLDEIGLAEQPVYVRDVFDYEGKLKDELIRKFEKEFKKEVNIIEDHSDSLFVDRHEHFNPLLPNAINSYALMLLPFSYYNKYKYIVFGNERNLSNPFLNKEGLKVYPSYDQTAEWVKHQTAFMSILTANKIKVFSPIEPIHILAIMKILNSRYSEYAKYQVSCHIEDESIENKWCGKCSTCSEMFAIMKALGIDVKERGFVNDMFSKEYKNFYALFRGNETTVYDKSPISRDEQLLAFYMAHRNGAKGFLMDEFKKNYLEEAKSREDELYKKYMGIGSMDNTPSNIRKDIFSIFKEELI